MNSFAVGNDCVNRLDSGSSVRSHCIGGFLIGEQVRFCRPAAKSSICDPIGSHVPLIWTGGLQRQGVLLVKLAHDPRTDPHVTGELVTTNGQKTALKPLNNINTWTIAIALYTCLLT